MGGMQLMKILRIDVQDGYGIIDIVVRDEIVEARLSAFIREAWAAIEEKEERETAVAS
jgi:hypothetical protein